MTHRWIIAVGALLCAAAPVAAHNGKVAVGVPLSGITVDGDLSDWPDNMRRYPIEMVYGLVPDDGDDVTASFRVGYDANAVYVAIDVIDDSILLAPGGAWNTRDGCEVYVDLDHEDDTPARQRALWARDGLYSTGNDEAAMSSRDGIRSYEWRIPAALEGKLTAGMSIGFDVVVEDVDEQDEGYSYISWGPMGVKFGSSDRVGDLLLVSGEEEAVGRVSGQLRWEDTEAPVTRGFAEVSRNGRHVATVEAGFDGSVSLELPGGVYAVRADSSRAWQAVTVLPQQTTAVRLPVPAPRLQRLDLTTRGPFRTLPLGARQNLFLHADAAGSIWFVGNRHLSRYDGRRVVEFDEDDLVHRQVTAVAGDAVGNTWISTVGGASRFDGESFQHFTEELADNMVIDLAAGGDETMWFATYAGLTRYDGSFASWTTDSGLPSGPFLAVSVDRRGRAWFGTEAGHIGYVYDREVVVLDSLAGGVWDLAVDLDGTVWAALGRHNQIARVVSDGPVELLTVDDGLPPGQVNNVFADRFGATWLMASSGILIRHKAGAFTAYDAAQTGLSPHTHANSATQDASGRIWFTAAGQVSVFSGHSLSTLRLAAEPDTRIRGWSLVETADSVVWMGTPVGLVSIVAQAQRLMTIRGLRRPLDLAVDPMGRIWAVTTSPPALWMIDGERRRRYSAADGLPSHPEGLTVDDHGGLWVGTRRSGIARLRGERFETFDHRDGLISNDVTDMSLDGNGGLWVATIAGLSHFDGERFTNYSTEDGLPNRHVTSVAVDPTGTVWAGTRAGAVRFDGATFHPLNAGYGLVEDGTVSIDVDRSGRVWLGTESSGVVRYDGTTFQSLTDSDGLPGQSVIDVFEDSHGNIWLTMADDELVRYRPGRIPPSVELSSVIADEHHDSVPAVSFPTTQPFVVFEFEGCSDATPAENLVYAYRLVGHDDGWRQTSGGRVEYRDLPRGDYTFELKAADRDHTYSDLVTVAVQVHWPYERFSWITALSIALCLVVWQTARVMRRDRQLTEQNRQLADANQRITEATDNKSQFLRRMAHDLRSPMNAIIGYTRLVLRKARGSLDERQVRNLENIETSSHNLLNLINEILDLSRIEAGRIEVNLQSVDVCGLAEECADSLESIVKEGVVLRRELNDVGSIHSDPDRLRQVLMNLLGNATKFTESGSITLSVKGDGDAIEISVADTGIGIPPEDLPHIFDEFRQVERQGGEAAEGTGLGLAIAKKTVELLGGTITATSEVGVGTTFTVRLGA